MLCYLTPLGLWWSLFVGPWCNILLLEPLAWMWNVHTHVSDWMTAVNSSHGDLTFVSTLLYFFKCDLLLKQKHRICRLNLMIYVCWSMGRQTEGWQQRNTKENNPLVSTWNITRLMTVLSACNAFSKLLQHKINRDPVSCWHGHYGNLLQCRRSWG